MTPEDWRGPINQILYGLIFTREITDEVIEWNVVSAMNYKSLHLGPDVYCRAICDALNSGKHLDGLEQLPQFTRDDIADFLQALASRLDSQRPWPEPRFRVLRTNPQQLLSQGQKIAELDVSLRDLMPLLRGVFDPVGGGQDGKHVLMLALQTGETVALLGSYARGEAVSLLSQGAEVPGAVIDHFIEATGIPSNKIVRV